MKLNALRLHNVKRFGGRGIAIEGIGDGVNVLSAANEHGKSTCFEALHALFFQPHTGTPKGVQLLRPYSGGNPLVEADIATAEGRFRLTKQFYGGKRATITDLGTGRLVAQADEAEAFIANLTRGGSAGPAGLLWVRQGITGIDKRSNSEEENEKRVRESLLSSVQGEVEALTGGRRMGEIAAAAEEELFKLVTATLRPKTGGRYHAAIEQCERLSIEEQRLSGEVTVLREALDKRRLAQTRLGELENREENAERLAAIAAAEKLFEAAKSHSELLKVAEAEAALAAHRRDATQQALTAFSTGLQRADRLAQQLNEATQRRDTALAKRVAVIADNDRATAAVDGAEREERDNRALLVRLEAALQARDAAERAVQLRQRLEQAERARRQVEDGEAALAVLQIPAGALEKLQSLEIDIIRLRTAQEATLPTLRIDYTAGASGAASIAGVAVADGHEQGFAGSVHVEIAGIGTLSLRSNRAPQADQALKQAEADYAAQLAALGVESLTAARQRHTQAREKAGELDLARQRLADLAPKGIAPLQAELARLTELTAAALEIKGDPAEVRAALAAAEQSVATTRNSARELQPLLGQAANGVVEAETALASLSADRAGLEALLGPVDGRAQRLDQLTADHREQDAHFATADAHAATLRQSAHDLVGAEATLRRTRSVQDAATQEAGQLRETLAELNGTIHAKSDSAVEEVWQETRETLAAAEASVQRFKTEVDVLDRLRRALGEARSAASELYLKPVITELRPLIGLLFDDVTITFDEDTLLPTKVMRKGQEEDVERLSGGMREQLSVLTRLAFARLLARDGHPAPVILDDALVYSDDDRIERMFDALHQQSRDQQILVFSCRQRAFAKLGGNVLQMQDWTPAL